MERVNNNKNRKNGLIENGQLFVKIVIFGVTLPFYEGQNLKNLESLLIWSDAKTRQHGSRNCHILEIMATML